MIRGYGNSTTSTIRHRILLLSSLLSNDRFSFVAIVYCVPFTGGLGARAHPEPPQYPAPSEQQAGIQAVNGSHGFTDQLGPSVGVGSVVDVL